MTQQQTVVISGGSSGIGLDLAKACTSKGSHVMLLARNQTRLDDALLQCEVLRQHTDQQLRAFAVDVADSQQVQNCADNIRQQIGTPDILILSAGIVACEKFMQQSDESFDAIMQINVQGSRSIARAFINDMVTAKRGNICFISSLGGLIPTYGYSAYSASKFAVVGMANVLRQELNDTGVAVTLVCPPEVDTPMVTNEAEHILPETRLLKDFVGTLDVVTVTKATLQGIEGKRFLVIPGVKARITYWQYRWFPELSAAITRRLIRKAGSKG